MNINGNRRNRQHVPGDAESVAPAGTAGNPCKPALPALSVACRRQGEQPVVPQNRHLVRTSKAIGLRPNSLLMLRPY